MDETKKLHNNTRAFLANTLAVSRRAHTTHSGGVPFRHVPVHASPNSLIHHLHHSTTRVRHRSIVNKFIQPTKVNDALLLLPRSSTSTASPSIPNDIPISLHWGFKGDTAPDIFCVHFTATNDNRVDTNRRQCPPGSSLFNTRPFS